MTTLTAPQSRGYLRVYPPTWRPRMPKAPSSDFARPITPKQPHSTSRRPACTRPPTWLPDQERRQDHALDALLLVLIVGVLAAMILPPLIARWLGGAP